jgi:hypothetical protein
MSRIIQRVRNPEPLGKAGLTVAILALVLATTGAAFAAGKLTSGQKKEVEKIAKKYAGKPGAPGAPGTPGTNGTNGKDGAPGAPGEDGTNVTNTAVPTSSSTCNHLGGAEFKVGSGAATTACNGQTGFTETLPPEKTEIGTWAAYGETVAPISFNIPLPGPLDENHVLKSGDTGFAGHCPGTAEVPEAAEGYLCVYTGASLGGSISGIAKSGSSSFPTAGASSAGAVLYTPPGSGAIFGTWAVTP